MKKLGFTLAEILITLGVIGVVAALTMPGLVTSSRNAQYSSALAVAVSNLETAFNNAIVAEGVPSLLQTSMYSPSLAAITSQTYVGNLKKYLIISGFESARAATLQAHYTNNGKTLRGMGANGAPTNLNGTFDVDPNYQQRLIVFETKNGATVYTRPCNILGDKTEQQIRTEGGSLFHTVGIVYIDVNGLKEPNAIGRDIFGFLLGSDGVLYPEGGIDASIWYGQGDSTWNGNGSYRCRPENGVVTQGGLGCTGRLINHNYEFDY